MIVIIVDDHYFDVTEYADSHPGGRKLLENFHMKDATDAFNEVAGHSDGFAVALLDRLCIGRVGAVVPPASVSHK